MKVLTDDTTGLPVARVRVEELGESDYNILPNSYSYPSEYLDCFSGVSSFRYREARLANTINEWYNHDEDNEFIQAFIRILDNSLSDKFAERVFSRYMRTYHPTIPFKFVTVRTGYSQGDWVDMLFVGDPDHWDWIDSPIERSYRALQSIDTAHKELGAFTRGDFHKLVVESAHITYDIDADTVNVEWIHNCTTYMLQVDGSTVTDKDMDTALVLSDMR